MRDLEAPHLCCLPPFVFCLSYSVLLTATCDFCPQGVFHVNLSLCDYEFSCHVCWLSCHILLLFHMLSGFLYGYGVMEAIYVFFNILISRWWGFLCKYIVVRSLDSLWWFETFKYMCCFYSCTQGVRLYSCDKLVY